MESSMNQKDTQGNVYFKSEIPPAIGMTFEKQKINR